MERTNPQLLQLPMNQIVPTNYLHLLTWQNKIELPQPVATSAASIKKQFAIRQFNSCQAGNWSKGCSFHQTSLAHLNHLPWLISKVLTCQKLKYEDTKGSTNHEKTLPLRSAEASQKQGNSERSNHPSGSQHKEIPLS